MPFFYLKTILEEIDLSVSCLTPSFPAYVIIKNKLSAMTTTISFIYRVSDIE